MHPLVVFFAFANDRVEHARYLRNLPEELRRVRAAMAVAEKAGLCEIVERANATAAEVLDVFQNPENRDRVALFHFGGHAGGAGLLLESAEGTATVAHAGGLSRFLGQQRGLTLVFLNGCSTAGQVQGLLDAGVLAVIATLQVIDDAVATELSACFYQGLASGASLKTAFKEAEAAVRTRVGESARNAYRSFVPEVMDEERWPWDLHVAPGAEERLAQWSLPREARDPLFGLPDLPLMDLPPSSPFKHLDWFTRNDAWVFFGRGREIRDLYEAVTAPDAAPIVLLFGETGVGKSSLLAAGLIPRLEASHEVVYLRRDGTLGLAGTLAGEFKDESRTGGNDLGAAWRARETSKEKPLVMILDQVEEAWTRPLRREEEDLAAALRSIFAVPENRPRGRLILSFREEWLAKVERLLDVLPRTPVPVTHLSRHAIAEVISGPASTKRLQQRYRLDVEPALPSIVADDLLEDPGSAIAPALQILLSKMWAVASQESPGPRRFTLALYQRLKREGILLDDFLKEQLLGLRAWRPDLVDSGLALDLLAHHTTPLGTAETRQAAEVVERYGGRPGVVELLGQCKDRYLLTGTARVQESELVGDTDVSSDKGITRLAHDTLAPLVRRRFEDSDLPGQRALRALKQRAVGWAGGKDGALLDGVDLGIVEQGAGGMPAWSLDEQRLIEASRNAREQRIRSRRALRIGAAVAAMVIAASMGVAWWNQKAALEAKQEGQDIAQVTVSGDLLGRDPTRAALVLLEVAQPDETAYSVSRLQEIVGTRLSESILKGHQNEVLSASFSPDGQRVVTASRDRTAQIWSVDGSGEPVVLSEHEDEVLSASFSPDGRWVVTTSEDMTARIWAADDPSDPVVLYGHEGPVLSASFSPDSRQVVTASEDKTARVWSVNSPSEPVVLRGHENIVREASFSPDGRRVVTASEDKTARIWSANGRDEPMVLRGHQDWVWSASFSPDGRRVVTASADNTARIWLVDGTGKSMVLRGHEGSVWSASFSPDSQRIVTASEDKTARIWTVGDISEPLILRGHEDNVSSATFSPDGHRVVTASDDKTARIWLVDGAGEPEVLRGHEAVVWSASFSLDSRRVVTASRDRTARIWSVDGFGEPLVLYGHEDVVGSASFSPDNRRVVTASADKTARIWSVDGAGEPVVLPGHKDAVLSASFSPDSRRVVTVSRNTARIWSFNDPDDPLILRGHEDRVLSAFFGPDGRRVVTASWDNTARVWSVDTGELLVLRRHDDSVLSASFSPDGRWVVTASGKTARIWSFNGTGTPLVLRGHEGRVLSASFSPDSRRVVTASADKTARIWPISGTGAPVVLRGHELGVSSASFSPDNRHVVTVSRDTVRIWSVDGAGAPVVLRGHEGVVLSASFSSDGRRVVTASKDKTARIWSADGTGAPVILRGHESSLLSAAFSPDGKRVVTASRDQTARVWVVSGTLLQAFVRAATPACLEPEFRAAYLGEPKEESQATFDRCRRCIGPWRRQFDARSIRAAPDEAWAKWQACMGR